MQPNAALAVFKGTMRGDLPLTFEVQPANANTNSTAVTITFIDSKGSPIPVIEEVVDGDIRFTLNVV